MSINERLKQEVSVLHFVKEFKPKEKKGAIAFYVSDSLRIEYNDLKALIKDKGFKINQDDVIKDLIKTIREELGDV